jgi:CBS domain-containing protein
MSIQRILNAKGSTVHTIDGSASVLTAAKVLAAKKIGALVVTDPTGRPAGLVTETELVAAFARLGEGPAATTVREVMGRDVAVTSPDAPVASVMDTMTRRRTRYVVVLDEGVVCGLVSIGDVVKARLEDCQLERAVLRDHYLAHR